METWNENVPQNERIVCELCTVYFGQKSTSKINGQATTITYHRVLGKVQAMLSWTKCACVCVCVRAYPMPMEHSVCHTPNIKQINIEINERFVGKLMIWIDKIWVMFTVRAHFQTNHFSFLYKFDSVMSIDVFHFDNAINDYDSRGGHDEKSNHTEIT